MPDFNYRAVDSSGNIDTGLSFAADINSLESRLSASGLMLIEVTEAKSEFNSGITLFTPKTKRREVAEFFLQLAALLKAGVNILDSLKTLKDDMETVRLKVAVNAILRDIESGELLHTALKKHNKVFPERLLYMIQAGEASGNLPETFKQSGDYLVWLDRLIKDIKQATIYPIAVIGSISIFLTILFTYVIPRFIKILEELKIELPLPTKIVIAISGFFVDWWLLVIGSMILSLVAVSILNRKSIWFKYHWDNMKLKLPIFGDLNKMFAISRFAQTFSTLFNAGIGVLEVLKLCKAVTGNIVFERVIESCEKDLAEGIMISDTLRKVPLFSSINIRMIIVGESSGDLGSAFAHIAQHCDDEIPRKIKSIFGIVEPMIILFLIFIVGFVAASIFLPLLSILSGIG
ncbi:MAG: type II secretion system F family protein [Nitrospinota bacterium]